MSALTTRLLLSAMLAGALAPAVPMTAAAQGVELDLSGRNPQLRLVDPEEEQFRRDQNRAEERAQRRRDEARRFGDDRCTADRALDKAQRLGIRRARVTAMGRRFIEVAGRRYGERVEVTFARDRRCSVVD